MSAGLETGTRGKMVLNCFHSASFRSVWSKLECQVLIFLFPAWLLVTFAMFYGHWFTLPFASYGVWAVRFCDYLDSCQHFPAVANDQPGWYALVQVLGMIGWIGITVAILVLFSSLSGIQLPIAPKHPVNRQQLASVLCVMSVFSISTCLIVFLVKLTASSPYDIPRSSSSTPLVILACLLETIAMLRMVMSSSFSCSLFDISSEKLKVGML